LKAVTKRKKVSLPVLNSVREGNELIEEPKFVLIQWEISETEYSKAKAISLCVFFSAMCSKEFTKTHFEYLCTDTQDCQFYETIFEASHLKVIEEVNNVKT
jgi:hypothetical protein